MCNQIYISHRRSCFQPGTQKRFEHKKKNGFVVHVCRRQKSCIATMYRIANINPHKITLYLWYAADVCAGTKSQLHKVGRWCNHLLWLVLAGQQSFPGSNFSSILFFCVETTTTFTNFIPPYFYSHIISISLIVQWADRWGEIVHSSAPLARNINWYRYKRINKYSSVAKGFLGLKWVKYVWDTHRSPKEGFGARMCYF